MFLCFPYYVSYLLAYHLCLYLVLYRPVIRGRPSAKRAIYICGQPRWVFVLISSLGISLSICFVWLWNFMKYISWNHLDFFCCFFHSEFCPLVYFMWFVHRLFGTTHWASWYAIYTNCLTSVHPSTCLILFLLFCVTATILHATLRTPNLKARLNTFREEFRAVWRNYSEI